MKEGPKTNEITLFAKIRAENQKETVLRELGARIAKGEGLERVVK